MQKQKTLITIFIILIVGVLGWYLVHGQNIKTQVNIESDTDVVVMEKDSENRPIVQIRKSDPDCNAVFEEIESDGIDPVFEHVYYGELKKDMPVQIILSCDQERFTITGAVNQIIDVNDKVMFPEPDMFNALADITNGSGVVYLEDDYNFDGYNDLASISSSGSEVYSYNAFLYDTSVQKFIFNTELSKLQNLMVPDYENKYISEDFSYYLESGEHVEVFKNYKWVDGNLVEIED